jgi:hypothetical protein
MVETSRAMRARPVIAGEIGRGKSRVQMIWKGIYLEVQLRMICNSAFVRAVSAWSRKTPTGAGLVGG